MSRGEGGAFEAEGWRERRKGRSGAYFRFMSIEALLLPFYSVVALFMVWVCYLVFGPSFLGAMWGSHEVR